MGAVGDTKEHTVLACDLTLCTMYKIHLDHSAVPKSLMPAVQSVPCSTARMDQWLHAAETRGHNPTTHYRHDVVHPGSKVWHMPIDHVWLGHVYK